MMGQSYTDLSNQLRNWAKNLGFSYEFRIRATLGFMFVLILIANLNSMRFFDQTQSVSNQETSSQVARNLQMIAASLRSNAAERIASQPIRDLASAAGFLKLAVLETDLLRNDSLTSSPLIRAEQLAEVRRKYALPKTAIGGSRDLLPLSISDRYENASGQNRRAAFFHFLSESGEGLTLAATIDASAEADISELAILNTIFQILSVLSSLTMAIMLFKITVKPYKQIKSDAIAAEIAQPERTESVDFAVGAFQKVIAELKEKEKRLQALYAQQREKSASLERYTEDVLRSMPTGVVSCSREGMITHFNDSVARILDIPVESGLNRHYDEALIQWPSLRNILSETLQTGEEKTIPEIEIVLDSNATTWLSITCSRVSDAYGASRGATLLISDISELKRLEAEILVKEQLALLGEMSAGLAHQLRNSMGAVIGFAQLLQKIGGESPTSEMAGSILKEARSTGEMLDRFLKLSRVSEISMSRTSLKEIESTMMTHFQNKLSERAVSLKFETPSDLPPLVCDTLLLNNVLINLIENAIQASSNGKTIKVNCLFDPESQDFRIEVSDEGKGMNQDQLSKIFTPFYTFGKVDGTGLGLALARKWIMAHGGEISCRSVVGLGTTFTIDLPAIPDNEGFSSSTTTNNELVKSPS